MKKSDLMLDILLKAIYKERDIYKTYLKVRDRVKDPRIKAMLTELAEEERKHRKLMLQEFRTLREMLQTTEPRKAHLSEKKVSYRLPSRLPFKELASIPGIDLAGVSLPSEFMGGDYLESFSLEYEDKSHAGLALMIGDIMGHGLMVVQSKAQIKTLFSNTIYSHKPKNKKNETLSTASLVRRFNEKLYELCQRERSIISLLLCFLEPEKKRLVYTCAGHNPCILITDNGANHTLLADSHLIIGVMKAVDYQQTEVKLTKGDILVLYTDGITEATNKKGKEFGSERLVELVQKHHKHDAKGIINHIANDLSLFLGTKPLHDDLTLTITKIK